MSNYYIKAGSYKRHELNDLIEYAKSIGVRCLLKFSQDYNEKILALYIKERSSMRVLDDSVISGKKLVTLIEMWLILEEHTVNKNKNIMTVKVTPITSIALQEYAYSEGWEWDTRTSLYNCKTVVSLKKEYIIFNKTKMTFQFHECQQGELSTLEEAFKFVDSLNTKPTPSTVIDNFAIDFGRQIVYKLTLENQMKIKDGNLKDTISFNEVEYIVSNLKEQNRRSMILNDRFHLDYCYILESIEVGCQNIPVDTAIKIGNEVKDFVASNHG